MADYIDLHAHSTESDGTLAPAELVGLAAQIGLRAIALTDHDTVSGLAEAQAAADGNGIELVPGIELSTELDGREVHILGYYVDEGKTEFMQELRHFRESRELRNLRMTEKLQKEGFEIEYADIQSAYPHSVITRAHFAHYLVNHGMVPDRDTVFREYLGNGCRCYVPREKLTPAAAISLIQKGGGVACFAHPILCHLLPEELDALVGTLKAQGLAGIEAVYSTYSPEEEQLVRSLAKKHGLLLSGGSDFHGANKPTIQLGIGKGSLHVPYAFLEEIKAALPSA